MSLVFKFRQIHHPSSFPGASSSLGGSLKSLGDSLPELGSGSLGTMCLSDFQETFP